ncbi:tyrosine-type recombinase/integrase [Streptomyces griseoluteus]|uniref:tyrosine-type recombinase/integrase n=1 Tax=Streptomyces griseoluteus TaxID=29306 RepID=UPI0037FBC9B5
MTVITADGTKTTVPRQMAAQAAHNGWHEQYPARTLPETWPATEQSRDQVLALIGVPSMQAEGRHTWLARKRGAEVILRWLETFPGATWQDRWLACPAALQQSGSGWHDEIIEWSRAEMHRVSRKPDLSAGMLTLLTLDVIRPSLDWLITRRSRRLRETMAEFRDPKGYADLADVASSDDWNSRVGYDARGTIARILAAKGGTVRDITVGDCLELRDAQMSLQSRSVRSASLFYSWLRDLSLFPPDAPPNLRHISVRTGQRTPAQLIDRYQIQNEPIRDLLVSYLSERQVAMDYTSLDDLSRCLGLNFWADLEKHHPGIDSLHLTPETAAAWKQRFRTTVDRKRLPDGNVVEYERPRLSFVPVLTKIRAFYLDIAQWAADDPARWGQWAVPCPIRESEVSHKKHERQQKARSRERTRERMPVLPLLIRTASQHAEESRARLEAVREAPAGGSFTVLGETFTKTTSTRQADPNNTTVAYDSTGRRRYLGSEENRAFWTWAVVEFLRHSGVRIEEMLESSHHSITQYKLPTTGEIVPLLQIAPSKTDEERVLLVSPEFADVLSVIVRRVSNDSGAIPLVSAYDKQEKVWNPPMPLLFQWTVSGENLSISPTTIRKALNDVLAATGLTDSTGKPLRYQPHDFRRLFVTDAIMSGLPPHIAQIVCGHRNLNTTMGYHAIYPADAIEAHHAFIARRRSLRPSEEYRTPTSEEWDAFLAHFEKRKLSIGTCARAFGTDCIHEHACLKCPMLRPEHSQRPRLVEIRDNLLDRIVEAEREGWLGELEKLHTRLAGAENKLTQLDEEAARQAKVADLGMPSFDQIAIRTVADQS